MTFEVFGGALLSITFWGGGGGGREGGIQKITYW